MGNASLDGMGSLRLIGKMGNASLDGEDGIVSLDGEDGIASLDCHFLKQVDYFSLVYESKEDSC